jgi:hypothetical protein
MSFIVSVLNRSDTCEVSTALRISEYSVLPFAGCGTSSSTGSFKEKMTGASGSFLGGILS